MIKISDKNSKEFVNSLLTEDIKTLATIPKTDYHNHSIYGGNRQYIFRKTGIYIPPLKNKLCSIYDLENYINRFTQSMHISDKDFYTTMIESTIFQACLDGVKRLLISVDAWCLYTFFNNTEEFLKSLYEIPLLLGIEIDILLQVGISRYASGNDIQRWLEHLWGCPAVTALDLYGPEEQGDIKVIEKIYRKSQEYNWVRVAHIGEWGSPKQVLDLVDRLELQQINHGICIVHSAEAMKRISENNITLHICPTSNVMLKRVKDFSCHPIAVFYRNGISVTINTDDFLVFGSSITNEYLTLFKSKVLTAEELDDIRVKSLNMRFSGN